MATPIDALYRVKRSDTAVTDGTEVKITCRTQMFSLENNTPTSIGYLEAGNTVTVLYQRTKKAFSLGFKFVYIQHGDDYGYIPKHVLNDYIFAQSNLHLTGVSYGGDRMLADGVNNDAVVFQEKDKKKLRCVRCGGSANEHKIYESQEAEQRCATVAKVIGENALDIDEIYGHNPGGAKRGIMIGILFSTKGTGYVGYSGFDLPEFNGVIRRAAPNFRLAPALRSTDHMLTDKLGNYLTALKIEELTGKPFDITQLVCAAPKLLQACYRSGEQPEFLSEKWVGRDSQHLKTGVTIKSCDRCRPILGLMLCPIRRT